MDDSPRNARGRLGHSPFGDRVVSRTIRSALGGFAARRGTVDHLQRGLVANRVVGHIAFSPVTTATFGGGIGLAPLSVASNHRRRGIGAELVRHGLAECAAAGWTWCVVLGDPAYYARFGFRPAAQFGLADEYGGGDAFGVLALAHVGIPFGAGLVRYVPEFGVFG